MLEIFPEQVLDNSLHTAILVGLLVTWLLFEAFGWVFAGFVVAGYLAALALVAPISLGVVLVESVLCYGLVWILGTGLPRAGLYSHVFGRERFLLFVLVAVPVRLVVTGLAMPRLTAHLLAWEVAPDRLGLGLFGVGIVLVPLTANTFYKLGLGRGLLQLAVSTSLTWLVVGPVLGTLTNFGFGDFDHTFDALAVSAWSSSRAVLVLTCTVFVAAQNNLRYGWDFGGILVPALLAVLVFEPAKYVATIVEIFVLAGIYEAVVRLPPVAALDLEGPRRIVSIYAVSWAWKFALAAAVGALALQLPVSDAFGFGYLLTSLVVARARKAGGLLRTVVPLVWTSAQGLLLALPLALLLGALPTDDPPGGAPGVPLPDDVETAAPVLATLSRPDGDAAGRREGAAALDALLAGGPGPIRSGARGCAAQVPPREQRTADRPLVLACGGEGPVLVVPRPRGELDAAWLAGWLAPRLDAAAVVVAAVDPSRHPTRAGHADGAALEAVVAARAAAGGRPVLVLSTAPAGPARLHLRQPDTAEALRARRAVPGLVLDTGAVPLAHRAWWPLLGPRDGALVLAPEVVPDPPAAAPRPLVDAVLDAPEALPRRPDLLVALVLPAARRAAAHPHDGPVPGWLHHLAGLVGAEWRDGVDPEGRHHWVLLRRADDAEAVDRWVFRPGGRPWTVIASQGWRWPGLVDVALHHHRALDARVTWLGEHPPRSGARWSPVEGRARPPVDRIVRALLAPEPGWRATGLPVPPNHVLLVEAAPDAVDAVLVSHGNEAVDAQTLAALAPDVATALEPWPGWRVLEEGSIEAAWQPVMAYVGTYQQAIAPEQLVVTWYPHELLREPRRAAEHRARLAWYRAAGVPVREVGDVALWLASQTTGDPLAAPEVQDLLAAHADTPGEGTLAALRRSEGWELEVWTTGLRLVTVARSPRRICTRVAHGGGAVAFPWSGCWERP